MSDTSKNNAGSIQEIQTLRRRIRELEQSVEALKHIEEDLRESETKYRFLTENMADVSFTVDLDLRTTYVSPSIEKVLGFTPEERRSQKVEEQLTPQALQLAFDIMAEETKQEEAEEADPDRSRTLILDYYHKDGSIKILETNLRGIREKDGTLKGFYGLSRDITDRKRADEERKKNLEHLRKALGTTIQIVVSLTEARDAYTAGHQQRVANLARAIASEMGLPRNTIEGIRIAASIHDIGKMSVPIDILAKPAKLTEAEFGLIKEHPGKGYEIIKDVDSPWPLAEIVYQHHERVNGSGYPLGLEGEDILLEARIIGVADVIEAMASHRPYRPALGINVALQEIEENSGILYDPDVAAACLKIFREKGFVLSEDNMAWSIVGEG